MSRYNIERQEYQDLQLHRWVMPAELAAVASSFVLNFGGDRSKGSLKKSVINDIAFVVLSDDDPVAGERLSFASWSKQGSWAATLRSFDEKRSARAVGSHGWVASLLS